MAQGAAQSVPQGSGSDPLAELARLIGQNDPFAEFGRDAARRPAAPRLAAPAEEWAAPPSEAEFVPPRAADPRRMAPAPRAETNGYYGAAAPQPPAAQSQSFPASNAGRQPYRGAPLGIAAEQYQDEHDDPGHPDAQAYAGGQSGAYEHDPYHPNNQQLSDAEEDFYDDGPLPRRRIGIMAIAAVFALAVVGTAGAFGYRALYGSSGSSLPPPVIKADTAPSKIVPAAASAQPNKLIGDRVNGGQGERLVSREEQPVAVTPNNSGSVPARMGSGIVGAEPKPVRTIAIRPDGAAMADASAAPPPASARVTNVVPKQAPPPMAQAAPPAMAPPPRVVSAPQADPETAPPPAMRTPGPRVVAPARQVAAAPPPGNAPLSLNPDAPAAPTARAAPVPHVRHRRSNQRQWRRHPAAGRAAMCRSRRSAAKLKPRPPSAARKANSPPSLAVASR